MHDYTPNTLNTISDRAYAANIIQRLLDNDRPEDIDWALLNGHSDLVEAMVDIFDELGPEGVRKSWKSKSADYPELQPPQNFRLFTIDELFQWPKPTWLIEKRVPENAFTILYAQPNVGKSFLALGFALQIAQEHPVVYLAAEGVEHLGARIMAWCKHHEQDHKTLQFRAIAKPVQLLQEAEVNEFIEAILPDAPKLVILDTLARCFVGGDENSHKDMSPLIEACEEIRRQTGATVLLVHHTTKKGDEIRGHGSLRAACQYELFLERVMHFCEVHV